MAKGQYDHKLPPPKPMEEWDDYIMPSAPIDGVAMANEVNPTIEEFAVAGEAYAPQANRLLGNTESGGEQSAAGEEEAAHDSLGELEPQPNPDAMPSLLDDSEESEPDRQVSGFGDLMDSDNRKSPEPVEAVGAQGLKGDGGAAMAARAANNRMFATEAPPTVPDEMQSLIDASARFASTGEMRRKSLKDGSTEDPGGSARTGSAMDGAVTARLGAMLSDFGY